jgi:hypothetical protein
MYRNEHRTHANGLFLLLLPTFPDSLESLWADALHMQNCIRGFLKDVEGAFVINADDCGCQFRPDAADRMPQRDTAQQFLQMADQWFDQFLVIAEAKTRRRSFLKTVRIHLEPSESTVDVFPPAVAGHHPAAGRWHRSRQWTTLRPLLFARACKPGSDERGS